MISRELASFLQEGVGIHIGTRNQDLQPNGARALAARVDDDGVHLEIYVAKIAAKRVLADLEANGQAAVGFGRPTDDRACQVKGVYVGSRAAKASERPSVLAKWESFLENLERIGIPRAGMAAWPSWPAVVIRLRATALFEQTPGPQAGTPLT